VEAHPGRVLVKEYFNREGRRRGLSRRREVFPSYFPAQRFSLPIRAKAGFGGESRRFLWPLALQQRSPRLIGRLNFVWSLTRATGLAAFCAGKQLVDSF